MENCVIYARFSSHGQNEQSIEAQVRICKEYAESKGLDVVNLYTDKARTGTNDARPAFQKMIADAKTGTFQYIIVYMFDRFARNRRDSIIYKEMLKEKYGVKVISALEPIAEDEGGEFYEMFLEWNAEKYSKRLSKRVRDGLDTSVANGAFCGGFIIYGYQLELEPIPGKQGKFIKRVVINEEEAKVMRYVFEQYDKGVSKKQIAEVLNSQGIRVKGKPVTHKTFDHYMTNPKYTGEFYFGDRLCTNMYPAIIDKDTFDRVQQRLAENRYCLGGKETAREPYLLTGKLFCGHCGTEMVAGGGQSKTGKKYYYYECKKKKKKLCTKRIEHKDKLEKYVVQNVMAFLSDEANLAIIVQDVLKYFDSRTDESELKSIRKRIADIQDEADAAANAFIEAKSPLLKQRIEKRMQECEVLLADLEKLKAQLILERGQKLTEKDIVAFINMILQGDVNDLEFRRRLIDNLVYKVYVSDENTYIYFNIKGGKEIEEITFEDTIAALETVKGVQTRSDPSRRERLLRYCVAERSFLFGGVLRHDLRLDELGVCGGRDHFRLDGRFLGGRRLDGCRALLHGSGARTECRDLVNEPQHDIETETHRLLLEALGLIVEGVIIVGEDGVLRSKCDALHARLGEGGGVAAAHGVGDVAGVLDAGVSHRLVEHPLEIRVKAGELPGVAVDDLEVVLVRDGVDVDVPAILQDVLALVTAGERDGASETRLF